jgi:hypothetical protein
MRLFSRRRCLAAAALLLLSATIRADAAGAELAPFAATYEVVFRGLNAGTSSLDLTREANGQWRYVSRNNARGLFRLALPGEVRQTSLFTLDDSGVRPLRYVADDGTSSTSRDIQLDFDWAAGKVRGLAEQIRVDLPLQPGLQDGMSVQIALMLALARGETPRGYSIIDKDVIKDYVYVGETPVRLRTAAGELDTVVWASHRPGSNRVTRVWYAPALGYLPVQAERRRGDKLEWSMRLQRWQR